MRWLAAFALLLVLCIPARAAEPRYADVVLTDDRGSMKDKRSFAPTTPKIFLLAGLADVPAGAKVRGVWIAAKTKAAPPDYKIDAVEMTVGRLVNRVTFSLTKPSNGWPVGDYRVELFINGKAAGKVPFKVAR